MFDIQSKPVAHMVAQIRVKQLATRDSQNAVKDAFVTYCEAHPDISDAEIGNQIVKQLDSFKKGNKAVEDLLKTCSLDDIGFPIKQQKTSFQLAMALPWAEQDASALPSLTRKGLLYHKLTNQVSPDALPMLASSNTESFWGNENPSVSSILLAAVTALCQAPFNMPGAATIFPFLNTKFKIPQKLVLNPFIQSDQLALFGEYQYGGHRDFSEQLLFGSEDCSSSVAKAIYLTTAQVRTLSTRVMTEAFNDPNNEYKLKNIVKLEKDQSKSQLKLIQPGDLYVRASHTAVIATKPSGETEICTVQFNRDLEIATKKQEGGGVCNYKLREVASDKPVYILRADVKPLGETCSLSEFLHRIDDKYKEKFPQGPVQSPGDCRIFFEENSCNCLIL